MASTNDALENGSDFMPRFGEDGLIPGIVTDADSGEVLMFAYMNDEAVRLTIATGEAHFWSRSRGEIWRKGETSGNILKLLEMRTDCDQDCLWLRVHVQGDGRACHTSRRSCFYRRIVGGPETAPRLSFVADV